ncbi:hypothetical protein L1887_20887 [Cichorium endivia]|nr:hypothetical protein L1887_20887 [Cichorium endivia]
MGSSHEQGLSEPPQTTTTQFRTLKQSRDLLALGDANRSSLKLHNLIYDLNAQQKQRRRKHRLKVIKGRKKNTSSSPESIEPNDQTSSSLKSASPPLKFGSSSSVSTSSPVKKQKAEIGGEASNEQGSNERAFLLAWLELGSIIIFEGLALAASGIAHFSFELEK